MSIGIAMAAAAEQLAPLPGPGVADVQRLPEATLVSQFLTGVLIYSLIAACVLYAAARLHDTLRRRRSKRSHRRPRTPQP